jgi:hypothetical protein
MKPLQKPWLIFPISRWARHHHAKNTRSSTRGGANIYVYRAGKPRDRREHMHRAALQGLRLVGNKLTTKEEEAYRKKGMHKPRSPHHHNSPRRRSRSRWSRSPSPKYYKSPRHGGTWRPSQQGIRLWRRWKKRWEHHALLAEFTPHLCPKYSNCPMISRNTTNLRSHSHGSQIIYK